MAVTQTAKSTSCPLPDRSSFLRKLNFLVLGRLSAAGFKIFKQDAPGNSIHHQMVRDKQQMRGPTFIQAHLEPGEAQERPMLEMKTLLQHGCGVFERLALRFDRHRAEIQK